MTARPTTVLQSFKAPGRLTNPYTTQLHGALNARPGVTSHTFTWRRAVLGHHDAVHLHWPEALIERRRPASTALRQALFLALLVRWRLTGTGVVRTVHNLELPSGLPAHQLLLLRLVERWTDVEVHLNEDTPARTGRPVRLVPHGHYTDWYAAHPKPAVVPGRVLFIGRIRRYKRVDLLVDAFRALPSEAASLHVVGQPSSAELADELRRLADADPRIRIDPAYVDDPAFVHEVGQAQVVVLPYPEMHNSGAVLAALSLGRPVLVPDNAVNRGLRDEVGPGWVLPYAELTADELARALDASPAGAPDLSVRDWPRAAQEHAEAYAASVAVAGRRRPARLLRAVLHRWR